MSWAIQNLFWAPLAPFLAAGLIAIARRQQRSYAAALAVGAMTISLFVSVAALVTVLRAHPQTAPYREYFNFVWFQLGDGALQLGWVLDPLTALMSVMVSLVGLAIFVYSIGYMAHDENFTRFFCFMSLFAGAMLGLVIANSLLLLFICWELVGVSSYLLIGFWHQRPAAAAAAKKAFITTRIGDMGFLLGMVWLYSETGTLLFYNGGKGCLEAGALGRVVSGLTIGGMAVSTAIALLIFCGAIGKSGQLPLHVWLPDAMEGPTPVSALIHAATMVAAGVFLVARLFPLFAATSGGPAILATPLQVVTWVGSLTAVFAALIAVAQTDIKRILAYSTVSQLGFMMMGIGVGGFAVGIFHLITHAFFKALLFLGAGSVIHGCNGQQDIRFMGGLRRFMPLTFATYAIGMMALAGVPLFFSGFWSKDEILHSALKYSEVSQWPFFLGLFGALLTAFYMTRQMCYVFFGQYRGAEKAGGAHPHESPPVMTVPLIVLSVGAVMLGFLGTPAWPWFDSWLTGHHARLDWGALFEKHTLSVMALSAATVAAGIAQAWWLYGKRLPANPETKDILEEAFPRLFNLLRRKLFVDEFYEATLIRLNRWAAIVCDTFDRFVWQGIVMLAAYTIIGVSWLGRFTDDYIVNGGFNGGCETIRKGGGWMSTLQSGNVQSWLRTIGLALAALVIYLSWA